MGNYTLSIDSEAFGKKLKQARIEHGIKESIEHGQNNYGQAFIKKYTQKMLAEDLGVPSSAVRAWEQGRSIPDFKMMIKICILLGCDLDYLFGDIVIVQFIHEQIGLSERAIEKLNKLKREKQSSYDFDLISHLIEETVDELFTETI